MDITFEYIVNCGADVEYSLLKKYCLELDDVGYISFK